MTEIPCYLIDSNIVLRFLVKDDPAKAAAAMRLLEEANSGSVLLEVPFTAISETVHTLRSFYGIAPQEVAREVLHFLKATGVKSTAPAWIFNVLHDCETRRVSVGDACIAAEARTNGRKVASFDRDFDLFAGVERFEPS